jgi:hypothetical protein
MSVLASGVEYTDVVIRRRLYPQTMHRRPPNRVRFAPESGCRADIFDRQLRARNGLMHRSKASVAILRSITSSVTLDLGRKRTGARALAKTHSSSTLTLMISATYRLGRRFRGGLCGGHQMLASRRASLRSVCF